MKIKHASLAVAVATAALLAGTAHANNLSYFTTVKDTDVASFGIGHLRDTGTGTLNVSGLSGAITNAYLYWHGPTNTTNATANAAVDFGGTTITGTNIGFSDDNFWNYSNSQAYRANVTSLVTGNGNYALSNFTKADANINGASLIVFFNDGNTANNKDVVLFNGNDANFNNIYDADNWNAALNGINYAGGPASLTLHVSDGQDFGPSDDGQLTINGNVIASGGTYQGVDAQSGTGGVSNGGLWDIKDFDISGQLNPGINNLSLTQNAVNDALSLIVAQFNLPVGAAPPPPPVPEPAVWLQLIAGFGMVGTLLRRGRRLLAA